MSVVAIKINKHDIEIASDSILVKGDSKRTNGNFHKLTKINDIYIGAVGDAQEASLFMHYCSTHNIEEPTEKCVLSYMCEFMAWVERYANKSYIENEYILVYQDKAFEINGLFVEEITDYTAIGAGEDFAMAALYLGHSPVEAVKVACDLSCYVAEPIVKYNIKK